MTKTHRYQQWLIGLAVVTLAAATSLPAGAAHGPGRIHQNVACGSGGTCLSDTVQWSSNAQYFVAVPNAPITFTLVVAAYPTVPTGSVSFTMDGAAFCSSALSGSTASATGTCAGTAPGVGTHALVGTYSGDANFAVASKTIPVVVMSCVNASVNSSCASTQALSSYQLHRGALLAPSPLANQPYYPGAAADPAWTLTSPAHTATVAYTGQTNTGASAIMGYDVTVTADQSSNAKVVCVSSCASVPLIQGLDPATVGLPADSTNWAPSLRKINSTYYLAWAESSHSVTQGQWCISLATSSYVAPGLLGYSFSQQPFELCASAFPIRVTRHRSGRGCSIPHCSSPVTRRRGSFFLRSTAEDPNCSPNNWR